MGGELPRTVVAGECAIYAQETPFVLAIEGELSTVTRTPSQRIEFIDGLAMVVAEQLVLVMGDVALATEVGFFLSAVGYRCALFTFIADGVAGVILLLAIKDEHDLVLDDVLRPVLKDVIVPVGTILLFVGEHITRVVWLGNVVDQVGF